MSANPQDSTRKHATKRTIPSSPTSASGNDDYDFPSIANFFEEVTQWPEAIHHNLYDIEAKLSANAIYQIDELEKISAEKLSQAFGLLWGDARFLEKVIAKGIRKVKKGKGPLSKRTKIAN